MIIASLLLTGVSITFTANASSLYDFIVLRFISGLGAGTLLASQATLPAEYSPEKYRAASVGVVTSGYPLGAMLTSIVAGYIMPEYGWRGMFWFGGSLTVAMVIVAYLLIPESLKYLFERRPDDALERVNAILKKLKKDTITAMPEVAVDAKKSGGGIIKNMLKLVSPHERA